VIINNEAESYETDAVTVGDALRQLAIQPSASDLITPPLETALGENSIIRIEHARRVLLRVDGVERVVFTPLDNPSEILAAEGIAYAESDHLVVDGIAVRLGDLANWSAPALHITVDHALPIVIEMANRSGEVVALESAAHTVGEALYEAGIPVYVADRVSPPLDTSITENTHILIQPALPITLHFDQETFTTHIQGETVQDALDQVGIMLMGQDFSIPSLDTSLNDMTDIQIVRVKEALETVLAPIPFEIVYQSDEQLPAYERLVMQEGREGILVSVYRVRYENEVVARRELISQTVARPPQDRLITYGINSTPG